MDSSELKRACEMAGLEVKPTTFCEAFMVSVDGGLWMGESNPALKPYIAELLTQRDEISGYDVSEMDTKRVPHKYECEVLSSELEKYKGTGNTPAEAVIRACMDVLGGGE